RVSSHLLDGLNAVALPQGNLYLKGDRFSNYGNNGNNQGAPIRINPNVFPVDLGGNVLEVDSPSNGNTVHAIYVKGGRMDYSGAWTGFFPFVVEEADVVVSSAAALTVGPGTVVKFVPSTALAVYGALTASGTPNAPVTFTSAYDLAAAPAASPNPAQPPQPGFWVGLQFLNAAGAGRLTNAVVRYAGGGGTQYRSDGTLFGGQIAAVTLRGVSPALSAGEVSFSALDGIHLFAASNPSITGVKIINNFRGVVAEGGSQPVINLCSIAGNASFGVDNLDASVTVNARQNWWGAASGPSHSGNPGGTGDQVSDFVDYSGFLTSPAISTAVPTITSPVVTLSPVNGSAVAIATPTITAVYFDTATGVNAVSVRLTLDGRDVTSQAVVTASSAVFVPASALSAGTHTVTASVYNFIGNAASASSTFAIDALPPRTTLLVATPSFGSAPVYATDQTTFSLNAVDDAFMVGDGAGIGIAQSFLAIDTTSFSAYAGAFNIPAEGLHTVSFYSVDFAGHAELIKSSSVAVDLTPPITTVQVIGQSTANAQGTLFVSAVDSLTLTATDPLSNGVASGVDRIFYVVDADPFAPACENVPVDTNQPPGTCANEAYAGPFALSAGAHRVYYLSEDNLGNQELANVVSVVVDTTPPHTTLVIGAPSLSSATVYVSSATPLSLFITDDASGVGQSFVAVDSGSFFLYAGAFTLAADSTHTIQFYSVDLVGNAEAARSSVLTVDATPPSLILAPNDGGAVFTVEVPTPAIGAFYSDLGSGVSSATLRLTLDGLDVTAQAVVTGSSAVFIPSPRMSLGSHTVTAAVADKVVNVAFVSSTFIIDDFPPVTTLTVGAPQSSSGTRLFIATSTPLGFTVNKPAQTFFALDAGAFTLFAGTFTLVAGGTHTLAFYSVDVAGYAEPALSRSLTLDAGPPLTQLLDAEAVAVDTGPRVANGRTVFHLIAQDSSPIRSASDGATTYFRIDPGTSTPFQISTRSFSLAAGRHVVEAYSVDRVANQEAPRQFSILIDTIPPVTTLSFVTPPFIDASSRTFISSGDAVVLFAADPVSSGVVSGVFLTGYQIDGIPALYTVPFKMAPGAHSVIYQSFDRAGNVEVERSTSIIVDNLAPRTVMLFGFPQFGVAPIYVTTTTSLALNAVDDAGIVGDGIGSGVVGTFISTGSSPFALYSGTFTLSVQGPFPIHFYSVDALGNREETRSPLVVLDVIAPVTLLLVNGAAVSSTSVSLVSTDTLSLAASDLGSGVATTFLSIDGGPALVYASTFSLVPGNHTLSFQSRDNIGNVESLNFVVAAVHTTPPSLTLQPVDRSTITTPTPNIIAVYASGGLPINPASVRLTLDGVDVTTLSVVTTSLAAFTPRSALSQGTHTVTAFVADTVGDAASATAVFTFIAPPFTQLVIGTARAGEGFVFIASATPLGFTTSEPARTFYSIDGGSFTLFSASFTIPSEGSHTVLYYSVDSAGLAEPPRENAVGVDATPPVTTAIPAGGILAATATVSLAAQDPLVNGVASGVARTFYAVDGGPQVLYVSSFTLSTGTHNLAYFSVDRVQNAEASHQTSFLVLADTTPPVSTLAVSAPSYFGFVSTATRFTLSAADPVTGGPVSGVAITSYSINGGPFVSSPLAFGLSGPEGPYAISYQSVDRAGNVEVLRSTAVVLDQTPPATALRFSGSSSFDEQGNPIVTPSTFLSFAASDAGSGSASGLFETLYQVDGGAATVYTQPFTLSTGTHVLSYYSIDNVQNFEPAHSLLITSTSSIVMSSTTVNGTITTDTHWRIAGSPFIVKGGNLTVGAGATLTIDPGVVVKFNLVNELLSLTVEGVLVASGTPSAPVYFTSILDESVAPGVTPNIFAPPDRGNWIGLRLKNASTPSTLNNTIIRYAGAASTAAVLVGGISPVFTGGEVSFSAGDGITLGPGSGSLSLSGVNVANNLGHGLNAEALVQGYLYLKNDRFGGNNGIAGAGAAVRINPDVFPVDLGGNALDGGNTVNGISVKAGTMHFSGVWTNLFPWIIDGDFVIGTGTTNVTLTITSGTVVKTVNAIGVRDQLVVQGTPLAPVTFTSREDQTGSLTEFNVANAPASGQWVGLQFLNPASASTLDHFIVRYAGGPGSQYRPDGTAFFGTIASVRVVGASPVLSNGEVSRGGANFTFPGGDGIRLEAGASSLSLFNVYVSSHFLDGLNAVALPQGSLFLKGDRFSNFGNNGNNAGAAIRINPNVFPVDLGGNVLEPVLPTNGNVVNAIYVRGGRMDYSGAWTSFFPFYVKEADLVVSSAAALTITSGTVVKFDPVALAVYGVLNASGTPSAPVTFTSPYDLAAAPAASPNPAQPPQPGNWVGLQFLNPSTPSSLNNANIRYAGGLGAQYRPDGTTIPGNPSIASVRVVGVSPVFNGGEVSRGNIDGIRLEAGASSLSLTGVTVSSHVLDGLNAVALPQGSLFLKGDRFSNFGNNGNNAGAAIRINPNVFPVDLGGNVLEPVLPTNGNVVNAIYVRGGQMDFSGSWTSFFPFYVKEASVVVSSAAALTITSGTVVKFDPVALAVYGVLSASGTPSAPVTFTSAYDLAAAPAASPNPAQPPQPGNWVGMQFLNPSTPSSLNNANIRYAGGFGAQYRPDGTLVGGTIASVRVVGVSPVITGGEISLGDLDGIRLEAGASSLSLFGVHVSSHLLDGLNASALPRGSLNLKDDRFSNYGNNGSNAGAPIRINPNVFPVDLGGNVLEVDSPSNGNTVHAIYVKGGRMDYSGAWTGFFPFVVEETDVVVSSAAALTVGPGTVVKFVPSTALAVYGVLTASGTPNAPVTFTSAYDLAAAPAASPNPAQPPQPGFWTGLQFLNAAGAGRLTNAVVRYAGGGGTQYRTDGTLFGGQIAAVTMRSVSPAISAGEVSFSALDGIHLFAASNPSITGVNIVNNFRGVVTEGGSQPVINFCSIAGNASFGVDNLDAGVTVNARQDWWGQASGPTHSGNPGGTGDRASDFVDYGGFLASPPAFGATVRIAEAPYTGSRTVDVLLNADVSVQLRLSEDPALAGAPLLPFRQIEPFTLSVGDGPKTVYVQFLSPAGSSQTLAAQTALDMTPPATQLSVVAASTATTMQGALLVTGDALFTLTAVDPLSSGTASGVDTIFYFIDVDPTSDACFATPLDLTKPAGTCANPDYAVPFQLSIGTHTLYFFAEDNVGNQEAVNVASVTVRVPDVLPPRTTLGVGTPSFGSSPVFVTDQTTFSLSAVDDALVVGDAAGVGTARTDVAVDTAAFSVYAGTFSISEEGLHAIFFRSADLAGNTEVTHSSVAAVDLTAPITTLEAAGASTITAAGILFTSSGALLSLFSTDPMAAGVASGVDTIFYLIDADPFAPACENLPVDMNQPPGTCANEVYTRPFSLSVAAHTLYFLAEDNVGNQEVVNVIQVTADLLPPRTSLSIGSPQFGANPVYVSTSTPLTLAVVDDLRAPGDGLGSGLDQSFVAVDSGPFAVYGGTIALASPGLHVVRFYSLDLVGNVEIAQSTQVAIDAAPPVLTLTPVDGSTVTTSTPSITAVYFDTGTGINTASFRLFLDGVDVTTRAAVSASSAGFTPATALAQGAHILRASIADNVGNTAFAASSFIVDSMPPTTTLVIGAPRFSTATAVFIATSTPLGFAVDKPAQTSYAVDNGSFTVFTGTFTLAFEGRRLIRFFSVDPVGLTEAVRSSTVTVDATAPVTTLAVDRISVSSASISIVSTDTLSLSASDLGSGVATTFLSIDGGAPQVQASTFSLVPGTHTVAFQSLDNVGNLEALKTIFATVTTPDLTAPSLTLTPAGGATVFTATPTIAAVYFDTGTGVNAATFRLNLDAVDVTTNSMVTASSAVFVPSAALSQGTHTAAASVADFAGNVAYATSTFIVDTMPPLTTLVIGDPKFSTATAVFIATGTPLGFTVSKPAVTRYAVDNGTFTVFTASFTLTAEGVHVIGYYSVDVAGLAEAVRSSTITVDATAPATSLQALGPSSTDSQGDLVILTTTPLSLSASDAGSGVARTLFSIDGASTAVYAAPFLLVIGSHSVAYASSDNVGNQEAVHTASVVVFAAASGSGGGTPGAVTVVARDSSSLTVSWDSNGNPSGTVYSVGWGTAPADGSCISGDVFQHILLASTTTALIPGLLAGTTYVIDICNPAVSSGSACDTNIVAVTGLDGPEAPPPFTTCGTGGGVSGLAIGVNPLGAIWEVVRKSDQQGNDALVLKKFSPDGTVFKSSTSLPSAVQKANWSLRFDPSGNVYAVGTSSTPQGSGDLTVYQVSPQGVLLSSVAFHAGVLGNSLTFDASGDIWIAGALQAGSFKNNTAQFQLALWRYCFHTGTLSLMATYNRGNNADVGFGVRVATAIVWVAGYSAATSMGAGGALDLALWGFDASSGTLIKGPYFVPNVLPNGIPQGDTGLKLELAGGDLHVAGSRQSGGSTQVGFYQFDQNGNLLLSRAWTPASNFMPTVNGIAVGNLGFINAAGLVRTSTGSMLGVWRYGQDGSFLGAFTDLAAPGGAHGIAFSSDTSGALLAVEGSGAPYHFFFNANLAGTDVLLSSAAPVNADVLPPRTTLVVGTPVFSSTTLYTTDDTTFSLTAVDDRSIVGDAAGVGVAQTFVAIDTTTFSVYAGTFSITTEGSHSIRFYSVDSAGHAEVVHSSAVAVDLTPPITSSQIQGSSATDAQGILNVSSTTTLALSATDPVSNGVASGVGTIFFVIDNDPFSPTCMAVPLDQNAPAGTCANEAYAGAFTLALGTHTVYFFSEDNVGNQETVHVASITVDGLPPRTSLTIGSPQFGTNPVYVSTATPLALQAVDDRAAIGDGLGIGVASTFIAVDSTAFSLYGGTFTLATQGTHAIGFYSVDALGNTESARNASVALDSAAPVTKLLVDGMAVSSTTIAIISTDTLSLAASDLGSGVATTFLSIDGGAQQVYASTFSLAFGTHTVAFQSRDNVGNLEALSSIFAIVRSTDTTPPVTTAHIGAPFFVAQDSTQYVSPASSITFTAVDPPNLDGGAGTGVARIEVSVDSAPFAIYAATVTLIEGRHFIQFRAVDNAGNVEIAHALSLRSDATAPVTSLNFSSPPFVDASSQTYIAGANALSFTALDPLVNNVASGVAFSEFRLDASTPAAPFSRYASSFTLAEGLHSLDARSQDNVGNQETTKTFQVRVDTTPPQTALAVGQPQALLPDNTLLVSSRTPFSLSAIDPVSNGVASGVSQTQYQINGGSFAVYGASFTLSAPDGSVVLSFQSRDNVGNQEILKSSMVVLDSTPPQVVLLCPGPQGFCSVVKGAFPVVGSVSDEHLASWRLEYAPGQNAVSGFVFIASGTAAVSSNILGTWDASSLSSWQTLRLSAADLVSNMASISQNVFVGDSAVLLNVAHDLKQPQGAVVDAAGSIYVADSGDNRIAVFTSTGGLVAIFDGTKKALGLALKKPAAVAVDPAGNIYIADTDGQRALKVSPSGDVLLTLSMLGHPKGIALDGSGSIYVSDTNNSQVKKFNAVGDLLQTFSLPGSQPTGIALDAALNLYVADPSGNQVAVFSSSGALARTLSYGLGLSSPTGVAADPAGNCVVIADSGNNRLVKIDRLGGVNLVYGSSSVFNQPMGAAFDAVGNLMVADRFNDRVVKLGPPSAGAMSTMALGASAAAAPSRATVVVRRALGGIVARQDHAAVVIAPQSLAQDTLVTVSSAVFHSQAEESAKTAQMAAKGLKGAGLAVEYGPEGTQFLAPATIILPYDPQLVAAYGMVEPDLKVHYWNPAAGDWQALDSTVDPIDHTVSALTTHFSLYQVLGQVHAQAASTAASDFHFVDLYAFPNPVRGHRVVTIRVQVGLADEVDVSVYDVSGKIVHQGTFGAPQIVDDGNGKGPQYSYDYSWDAGSVGSGVYVFAVTAKKGGVSPIRKVGKVGVIH
ncbi:MAG: hypothetical protein HY077_10930, partial [Elusimicrobia bacterium]|nr:hypothetical protein [Elusimicrobiota bacterium]